MSRDPDCIFCKIVAGEIPCFKLYDDEMTLAFMDINPVHPGHALNWGLRSGDMAEIERLAAAIRAAL